MTFSFSLHYLLLIIIIIVVKISFDVVLWSFFFVNNLLCSYGEKLDQKLIVFWGFSRLKYCLFLLFHVIVYVYSLLPFPVTIVKIDHTWLRTTCLWPSLRYLQNRVYYLTVLIVKTVEMFGCLEMGWFISDLVHLSHSIVLTGCPGSFVVDLVQSLQMALIGYLSL